MKKHSILVLLIFFSVSLFSEKYLSEIKPLTGERWYGAYTAKAGGNTSAEYLTFHPYAANVTRKDLRVDNHGNQAAPLFISNMGRYIWSDQPFAFELKEGVLNIYSDTEELKAITAGKNLREAYLTAMKLHFPASGKTPDPLLFKMPQYNTWIEFGRDQNQKGIIKYADDILKNKFPTGVFMIDDCWSNYYGNFEFDATKFPDPKGMMEYLHAKGFKVMLWLTPFVSPDSPEFRYLKRNECLVTKKGSNQPVLINWWNGYSACLDLSKPKAYEWLKNQLITLQEKYNIDGFKFDAADFHFYSYEPNFRNEDTNTTGPIQAEMFAKLGSEFAFNEFRACWKNGNQPLAQRLQDKAFSWYELKLLVPDMISAGLIGHPYTCPDMIGGGLLMNYETMDFSKYDQELMIRSAQTQALMPMMQFSVAPWKVLDEKHLEICRQTALLHTKMGDYINQLAQKAAIDGEPIVRHLEYVFPHQGFLSCDDQYMLGDDYLVCPMLTKDKTREVRLPKGNWVDDEGKKHKGGKTITINVPLTRLPYFVRQK